MFNLDGLHMYVSQTASNGVVSSGTQLRFQQRGDRIMASYCGDAVRRGVLVGRCQKQHLTFRYVQIENDGSLHSGSSEGTIEKLEDGRTRIIENFVWKTRSGRGVNTFDEIAATPK